MEEKMKVLMVVWEYLGWSMWWLEKMVKSGEILEAEAGWMIHQKNQVSQ
jgi:hypothetical protein